MLKMFHILIASVLLLKTTLANCTEEPRRLNTDEDLFSPPNVTEHLGPVSIASLNLVAVFNCLQNYTNFNRTVGYTTGVVGVKVNVSEIGIIDKQIMAKCCDDNDYNLNQLDYLVLTDGHQDQFLPLSMAQDDQRIVYSNIRGSLDTADNVTDHMDIGFSGFSWGVLSAMHQLGPA